MTGHFPHFFQCGPEQRKLLFLQSEFLFLHDPQAGDVRPGRDPLQVRGGRLQVGLQLVQLRLDVLLLGRGLGDLQAPVCFLDIAFQLGQKRSSDCSVLMVSSSCTSSAGASATLSCAGA